MGLECCTGMPGCQDTLHARTSHHHPGAQPQHPASYRLPLSSGQLFLQNPHSFSCICLGIQEFPFPAQAHRSPLSKHSYQLSTRQFPLRTLLAGREGQAAMHRPPDVFPLSLPFCFILLHCSNRAQELKRTSLIPPPVTL